ncbi:MAG: hypothetical protein WC431_06825 [Candidatus Omnitrophota bacterium]|jgi:hypothetical protein
MNKKKIIFLREFLGHPLVVSICSGLIIGIVGIYLTDHFAQKNLEKQMQLELYRDLIHQQSEFVDHLTKDIYRRIYKLSALASNLKNGNKAGAEEFKLQCKLETIAWSEELMFYLINLDRYFPKDEYRIGKYIIASELFKDCLSYSFRQILEKNIQPSFYSVNSDIKEMYSTNEEVAAKSEDLHKRIDNLYKRIYEFNEAMSKASMSYKISTKTKLEKNNFK